MQVKVLYISFANISKENLHFVVTQFNFIVTAQNTSVVDKKDFCLSGGKDCVLKLSMVTGPLQLYLIRVSNAYFVCRAGWNMAQSLSRI